VARRHIFDELKDHIGTLPDWDGTARADGWLSAYAGADTAVHSTEYLALIGSKYLMQTLNRALNPGAMRRLLRSCRVCRHWKAVISVIGIGFETLGGSGRVSLAMLAAMVLAAVLITDRLQPAERHLVEALYTRAIGWTRFASSAPAPAERRTRRRRIRSASSSGSTSAVTRSAARST
jgi:hypothetical protein